MATAVLVVTPHAPSGAATRADPAATTLADPPVMTSAPMSAPASAPMTARSTATLEQPTIPRHLVHHNFKKATPTRWCSRHRVVCVHELARRFHRFLARHPRHRSDWGTAAKRRAWHHRYIRSWRARYDQPCTSSSCAKMKGRSLSEDWSRFSRAYSDDRGCDFAWMPTYRSPQYPDDPFYGFDCRPHVATPRAHLGTEGKIWLLCEAGALVSAGTLAVASGGVTTPVVLSVVSQSTDCATVWSLMHSLNWP